MGKRRETVHRFPDPELAGPDGLLAMGGDLSPERLVAAYTQGIFPWYSPGEPILWWSPDPRWLLSPADLHVPRSLSRVLRRRPYRITADRAFDRVLLACARARRPGQSSTWITPEMRQAYARLHEAGIAHSVEAWDGRALVGGLYGVALGGAFFGESMFAARPDASKVAFVTLVKELHARGFGMVDCQVHTPHLERFGARACPRAEFLARLCDDLTRPGWPGHWLLDDKGGERGGGEGGGEGEEMEPTAGFEPATC